MDFQHLITRLKRWVHVVARSLRDALSRQQFCKKRPAYFMPYNIQVKQPFTASATLEQKKQNLRLAAERIYRFVVMPGEVFSFWRTVGNPNTKAFAASRGIRGGVLQLERGGGLCQASGIIHHLSLLAGLEVVERYNHSKDLYTEETRFCPLGSDATVAYGYRDLRVRNTTASPLRFELQVHDDHFEGWLTSMKPLEPRDIVFERTDRSDGILTARVIDRATGRIVSESEYERLEH